MPGLRKVILVTHIFLGVSFLRKQKQQWDWFIIVANTIIKIL